MLTWGWAMLWPTSIRGTWDIAIWSQRTSFWPPMTGRPWTWSSLKSEIRAFLGWWDTWIHPPFEIFESTWAIRMTVLCFEILWQHQISWILGCDTLLYVHKSLIRYLSMLPNLCLQPTLVLFPPETRDRRLVFRSQTAKTSCFGGVLGFSWHRNHKPSTNCEVVCDAVNSGYPIGWSYPTLWIGFWF